MPDEQGSAYIAHLTLHARTPDGRTDTVVVAVGAPVRRDELEWQCPIRVLGLGRHWDGAIAAADSMQALGMAMSLVTRTLRDMRDEGNRLFMPPDPGDVEDGEMEWPYEAYFGVLDRR